MSEHVLGNRWSCFVLMLALATPAGVARAQQADATGDDAQGEAAAEAPPSGEASATEEAAVEEDEGEADESSSEEGASQQTGDADAADESELTGPADEQAETGAGAASGGAVTEETAAPRQDEGAEVLSPGGTIEDDLAAAEAEAAEAQGEAGRGRRRRRGGHADHQGSTGNLALSGLGGRRWTAMLIWDNSFTAYTLDRDAQMAYNPTYSQTFTFFGSYRVVKGLNVRTIVPFGLELTPSENTTTEREWWLYDSVLDAQYSGLPRWQGIMFLVGPRLFLPFSPSSQGANRMLGVGAYGLAMRTFKLGGAGSLMPTLGFSYRRWLATSNVVSVDEPFRCRVVDAGGTVQQQCTQYPGPSPVRDTLSLNFTLIYDPIPRLNIQASFAWFWNWGPGLADAVIEVDSAPGGTITIPDRSITHMRGETRFSLQAGYTLTKYLTVLAALNTPAPHLDTDGKPENPFWNERSQIIFSAWVNLAHLYDALGGAEENGNGHAAGERNGGAL